MSKTYKGQITNSVVELTLQEEAVGAGFDTPTIVWDDTQGTIDQVMGAIPDNWKNLDGSLKQLQIGSSCTSIGSYAFRYCSGLTGSLTIPDSVTSIGSNAFYFCQGFNGSLTIGNSVTSIGTYAFAECSSLTGTLTLPSGLTTLESGVFNSAGFTGDLVIPDGVTTIGGYAFNGNNFTGDLVIPDGVTTIGDWSFSGNDFTGDLVIPNSVTTIGSRAFVFCSGLTALYTNTPAASWVGTDALLSTTALVNIYYGPNTNDGAGYSATFQGGSGMTVSAWTNYPNIP